MENLTPSYKIIFDGQVMPGVTPELAKQRMAALFKVDTGVIEKIFRQCPYTLQRNRDKETALRYKQAFEQTGALCRLEVETPGIDSMPAAPTRPTSSVPPEPPAPPAPHVPPVPPVSPVSQASPSTPAKPGIPGMPPPVPGSSRPRSTNEPAGTLFSPVSPVSQVTPVSTAPRLKGIEKETWKTLGGGLGITLVVLLVSFLSFIFHYIVILVHELGHAIFGWLYGYPSVPAFDFMYGGGLTSHQDRKIYIVIIVYLLLAGLFYLLRRYPLLLAGLGIFTLLYTLTAFTIGHQLVILFMGHGTELIFGAIFLYRGLSGSSIIVPAERPLYAFLGFFVLFVDMRFAYRLMSSEVYRAEYGAAKGGGDWMDFSRIANEILGVEVRAVASFFLLLCILTPLLVYLFYRYKEYIDKFFRDSLGIEES